MRLVHGSMVLKTVPAHKTHQSLQIFDLHYCAAPKSVQRIIYKSSVTDIRSDDAMAVVRGDAGIAERAHRGPAGNGAVSIVCSKRRREDFRIGHFHLAKKTLRPIAAMEQYALVRVIPVVVVPID